MSVAPISTQLSIKYEKKSEEFDGNININYNLLQVTIVNRAIIYDLRDDGARAIRDISDL